MQRVLQKKGGGGLGVVLRWCLRTQGNGFVELRVQNATKTQLVRGRGRTLCRDDAAEGNVSDDEGKEEKSAECVLGTGGGGREGGREKAAVWAVKFCDGLNLLLQCVCATVAWRLCRCVHQTLLLLASPAKSC